MEKKIRTLSLTLIEQCPMSNLSDLLYCNMLEFEVDRPLFLVIHTDRHTGAQTDGHEYSIVAVGRYTTTTITMSYIV